jgi:hypothetical protein
MEQNIALTADATVPQLLAHVVRGDDLIAAIPTYNHIAPQMAAAHIAITTELRDSTVVRLIEQGVPQQLLPQPADS